MEFSNTSSTLLDWSGSVLLVGLVKGQVQDVIDQLEKLLDGSLKQELDRLKFTAESSETASFRFLNSSLKKLVLVGLGNPEELSINELRKATAAGVREAIDSDEKLGIFFPWDQYEREQALKAVSETAKLCVFKDLRFQSAPETKAKPKKIEFIGTQELSTSTLEYVHASCAGVELARELVGAPANKLTPSELARKAGEIAKENNLECLVLERNNCRDLGMGAYLAVSQGSDLEPKFIHLTYRPNGAVHKKLALVGKGLTFDSGGYNLKVGASQIELMKFDMGGSAAVLGAAMGIGKMKPLGVEVHFIVAACENMVNGSAIHPGDIVQASNGKTIEINNTDAEGRLTLADALVYACKLQPDKVIDLATLTGACVIALGEEIAGLWTNNDELARDLESASNEAGENLWRMPLRKSYKDGLKSLLADLKNTGPRAGGSITAALFLNEFVDESIPWAHLDIAGTVWAEKDRGIDPAGATGYGVRTLLNWVLRESKK